MAGQCHDGLQEPLPKSACDSTAAVMILQRAGGDLDAEADRH